MIIILSCKQTKADLFPSKNLCDLETLLKVTATIEIESIR